MKLAFIAGRREREPLRPGALLSVGAVFYILTMTMGAVGQVPMAEVRGTFSGGNGSWDAESFGWFYYDLDEGFGGERLAVETEERRIPEGSLYYSSGVWTEEFDYPGWGRYQAVAFLGKRYLAGYLKSNFTDAVSALEEGELREVLLDYEGIRTATSKAPLLLEGGYWIEVAGASSDGKTVYLILKKNGVEVDRAVVRVGDTYAYKVGDHRLPIILASVSAAMQGTEMAIVDIDGLFQVRDVPTFKIEAGDQIGAMEVTVLAEGRIELENAQDIILRRGSTIPLAGGLMLRVRDTPELIYYPLGEITEYGFHEIRGPVYTDESLVRLLYSGGYIGFAEALWNYQNFTGFYFDDEDDVGSEMLLLYMSEGGSIEPGREFTMNETRLGYGFKYNTLVEPVEFEFDEWGSYDVIALFGQLWFAGYGTATSAEIGSKSMIETRQVGQVLLDSDESFKIIGGIGGIGLKLKEGYLVRTIDVSKDSSAGSVFIQLFKENELIDSAAIQSNSTYVYKKDVGDVEDLPVIVLHVGSVFSGDDEQFAIVDGIFQLSDHLFFPIDEGNDFVELEVKVVDPKYIIMANPEWIHMPRDSTTSILPSTSSISQVMSIAVADNETYRYYLYESEYVVPFPKIIEEYLPEEPVPSGGAANFSISVQAGEILSVSAEIFDSDGRLVIPGDVTGNGFGAEDQWLFSWQWNVTVPALSDDGTALLDSSFQEGVLKLNNSTYPISVLFSFDESWRIKLIQDKTGEIYYISPEEYEKLGAYPSYEEMASNETLRSHYVKVEPGVSEIRFFQVVNGTTILDNTSHKLWFSPQGIEPHLVRVGAPPGRYELRLRVENVVGVLQATERYFYVSGPDLRRASVASATVAVDERFSLPLAIPASENETKIILAFDPDHLSFEGIKSDECDIGQDQSERGRIALDIPGNCSALNLTFRADGREGTSEVEIVELVGIEVDELVNGTVNVTASRRPAGRAPAPGAAFALLAMGLAFALAGRRRR